MKRQLITTGIVLTLSFIVISSVATVLYNLQSLLTLWGESLEMSVYLKEDYENKDKEKLEKFLNGNVQISKLQFVSRDRALNQFKEQINTYAPDLVNDKEILKYIPASFQFGIASNIPTETHAELMKSISEEIKQMSGVEEVSYGQNWVKNYSTLAKSINNFTWMLIFSVLFSSALVIFYAISSSIHQRKSEIEVLELIGATNQYIRRPYYFEGAILGLISSGLAILITYSLYRGTKHYLMDSLSFVQILGSINFINFEIILIITILGGFLGLLSSHFSLMRINNGWAASQSSREFK